MKPISGALLLFVATVIGSLEVDDQRLNLIGARSSCPVGDNLAYCLNCDTIRDCDKAGQETNCSSIGFACGTGTEGGLAACYSSLDNYDIQSTPTNNICHCKTDHGDGSLLPDSNYRDPFNANSYVSCTGGVPTYANCGEGEVYHDADQACVAGMDCGLDTTPMENPLNCGTYFDCSNEGKQTNCDLFQIYDLSVDGCVDPIADACALAGPHVFFSIPGICYLGVMCDESSDLLTTICCYDGEPFEVNSCTDGVDTCADSPPLCVQEYWEQNSVCNQCVDTSTFYATRTECSEYYYNCEDRTGTVLPYLKKCPDEFPVFNPVDNYCDIPSNVAEC